MRLSLEGAVLVTRIPARPRTEALPSPLALGAGALGRRAP